MNLNNSSINKPNFFIVGAPRCGTTALYTYLKRHPDIFMSAIKEPHYFAPDLQKELTQKLTSKWITDKDTYFKLFKDSGSAVAVGEASASYLYSKSASQEIYNFNPSAKIIIMLRQPVDMMYSLHHFRLLCGNENNQDFHLLFDLQSRNGNHHPVNDYRDIASYFEQVKRYYERFPRDQIHVIIFDDFIKNTGQAYRDILQFLGVDTSFQTKFDAVNMNREVRSSLFHKLIFARPAILQKPLRLFLPQSVRHKIFLAIRRPNIKKTARSVLDPALHRHLTDQFKEEIINLSKLIKRNLNFWT